MKYQVTFREVIPTYWTTDVEAGSEEEARQKAQEALDEAITANEYEPEPYGGMTREICQVFLDEPLRGHPSDDEFLDD